MKAQILMATAAIACLTASPVSAQSGGTAMSEETWLMARLNAQRMRIQQLRQEIRSLSVAAGPASAITRETPLRMGLTPTELRGLRGEPNQITRAGRDTEIWGYGATRVTLVGGRVTAWQTIAPPTIAPRAPQPVPHGPACDDCDQAPEIR
jgi:hypothetical protein